MADPPFDADIRVGEIVQAKPFPEAEKPTLAKLWIDLDEQVVQSAAQLLYHHDIDDLSGKQVLCAVGLGTVRIAGFES